MTLPLLAAACALDNGLGLRPRLAYSTWNFFGTSANETHVKDIALALERTGLKALGFNTVSIDAGSVDRDLATGKLVGSRRFPSGLRSLSDFLHSAGFRFGAYNDISGHTCGNGPRAGMLGHYEQDAETFAHDWAIDYLKVDFCGVELPNTPPENCTGVIGRSCGTVPVESSAQYSHWLALTTALNRTGRPIYLDYCPHAIANGEGTEVPRGKLIYAPPADWSLSQRRALANSLLVEFENTWDAWTWGNGTSGLIFNIDAMVAATRLAYSAPGMWNYADMLQVCAYGRGATPGDGMTLSEYRVHYAVWAILASPLVLGADVRDLERRHPECLALLKTRTIVAVNQDPAALPPRLVSQAPPLGSPRATTLSITSQVFCRPLSGGRFALLLVNRGGATTRLTASWAELGLPAGRTVAVFDVVTETPRGTATDAFEAAVPSHDVAFVILQPQTRGSAPLHRLG